MVVHEATERSKGERVWCSAADKWEVVGRIWLAVSEVRGKVRGAQGIKRFLYRW